MEQNKETTEFNLYTELKIFGGFFIEIFLLLIIIQFISDKIDNSKISFYKEAKMSLIIACILYIAKLIHQDTSDNIRQGMHYAISGVFLSQYPI